MREKCGRLFLTLVLAGCAGQLSERSHQPLPVVGSLETYPCRLFRDSVDQDYLLVKYGSGEEAARPRHLIVLCDTPERVGPPAISCQDGYAVLKAASGHFSEPFGTTSDGVGGDNLARVNFEEGDDPNPHGRSTAYISLECVPDPSLPPIRPHVNPGIVVPQRRLDI